MNVLSPLREQFHDNRFLQSQIQLSEESSLLGQGTYSLILYYGVNGEDNHESISPHSEEPRNELIINVQDLFDALLFIQVWDTGRNRDAKSRERETLIQITDWHDGE